MPYFSKKVEKLRAKRPKAWKHANSEVQKQRTLKHRNTQNRSKYTNHKSQTMTFWTCWSKLLFPKRSAKMIDGRTEPSDFDLHCRKTQNPKTFLQHRTCTIQNSCKKIYIHCCHSEPETGDFPWLLWAWPLATCNLISHLLCTCNLYGFQLEILVSDSPDIVSCTFFSLRRWCFILLYIVFVMHLLYLIFFRSTMVQFCSLKALKTLMVGHCLLNPTF